MPGTPLHHVDARFSARRAATTARQAAARLAMDKAYDAFRERLATRLSAATGLPIETARARVAGIAASKPPPQDDQDYAE
jgi:hypothetical protein